MFSMALAPLSIIASLVMLALCLGLFLVVLLQPQRRHSNYFLMLFLAALSLWALAELAYTTPQLHLLDRRFAVYLLGTAYGASALTLYFFTRTFCGIKSQFSRSWGLLGGVIYLVMLVLLWSGQLVSDFVPAVSMGRSYTITALGWLGMGVIIVYTASALIYQWLSKQDRARHMILPTLLLLVAFSLHIIDVLARTPVDILLASLAAVMLGQAVLRLELFSPLSEANQQLRVVNHDLRQAIIELSAERDKVEQLNEELQDASRYKSEFLANMSHELRTPLNSIVGYSELLLQNLYGPLSDKQRDRLEKVHRNGRNLLAVINDILDLSKIEAGRLDMSPELIDLRPLIDDVMPSIEMQAEAKELDLKIDVHRRLPPIHADPLRVRQVLINLLSNAVKFTREGGITLKLRSILVHNGISDHLPLPVIGWLSDGPWLIISVIDTGIGIAPENQAEIFEEFKQIDSSSSREFEGTGLGLAITKRLIEMHRGRIWVQSALGAGSTFYVAMPAEATDMTQAFDEPVPLAVDQDRQSVLILHDDAEVAERLAAYLDREGYHTLMAFDIKTCIENAQEYAPDALMVEITMSGMRGWELIGALKRMPNVSHIPVIVASIVEERLLGFALGPTDHIAKPIQQDTLHSALNNLDVQPSGLPAMVVSDNDDERDIMETYLSSAGYQVMAASSGREAVSWLSVFKVSLVLVDLLMKDVTGFEVLAHMRQNKGMHDVPVLVVSTQELTAEEEDALNVSITDTIQQQPIVRHDLVQRIIKTTA